jgi:hypothetical protein
MIDTGIAGTLIDEAKLWPENDSTNELHSKSKCLYVMLLSGLPMLFVLCSQIIAASKCQEPDSATELVTES